MKITLVLLVALTFLGYLSARDIPQNVAKPLAGGPSLEYEIIDPLKPLPAKPINVNTQSTNKTFTYDPSTQTWTPVKSTDPEPKEGTLVWNQNNDKWLTQSFRP